MITTTFSHIDEFPPLGSCDHTAMQTVLDQHAAETNKFNSFIDELNNFETGQNNQYSAILNTKQEVLDSEQRVSQAETRINNINQQIYAYHMQNLATLPVGTINNDLVSWNTAWSSSKIKQLWDVRMTETPTVTGTTEVYEGRQIVLSAAAASDVKIRGEAQIGTIVVEDDVTYYVAPETISEDGVVDVLHVYAIKEGFLRSDNAEMPITLRRLTILDDGTIIFDATTAEDKDWIIVDGSFLKAIRDDASFYTPTYAYSYSLKKYQISYTCHPADISVVDGSTSTILKTNSVIGDNEYIIVSDGTKTSRVPVSPTQGTAQVLGNPDPFGDGSGVGYWELDGDAIDKTGNYDGNLTASNATFVAGKFGQALQFAEEWNVGLDVGEVNNRSTGRTITCWVKDGTSGHVWHAKEERIYLYFSDGKLRVTAKDTNDNFLYEYTDVTVNDGNWHFVALVINAGNTAATLNVDGANVKTLTIDGGASTNAFDFTGFGEGFDGKIDDARYFSRELSQSEIQQIMENQSQSYEVDITGAGLGSPVVSAFRDIPKITVTADQTINEVEFTSLQVISGDVSVDLSEHAIDNPSVRVKVEMNNDDVIKSITIHKWKEGAA